MDKTGFWQLLEKINRIEVPLIQRDYAQGRPDEKTRDIAERFVEALANAVERRIKQPESDPLFLDFIFGSIENEIFIPYDGQQRLTTLWLLHLYAAYRANRLDGATVERLARFRYAVREDTGIFCQALLRFLATLEAGARQEGQAPNLGQEIREQGWFLPQWKQDPTIKGMLTMLDYIDGRFFDLPEAWDALSESSPPPIQFAFQDIAALKTTGDELFIKMNARGKQLTDYEIFKSRFLDWLGEHHPDEKAVFTKYLNINWQNLFWRAFGKRYEKGDKAQYTDACLCRFLRWLADMLICFAPEKKGNLHDLCRHVIEAINAPSPCEKGNLWFVERAFDALIALEKRSGSLEEFFGGIFLEADDGIMPEKGKISWFKNNHVDLLYAICAEKQPATAPDKQMFFAILLILAVKGELGGEDKLHLRILRNLLANSTREVYEARFPAQLPALAKLVLQGALEPQGGYNGFQLKEEAVKLDLRQASGNQTLAEKMDWLEDHPYLRGCLAMFSKIPNPRDVPAFEDQPILEGHKFFTSVFGNQPLLWDTVLQGLLCAGEFGLQDSPSKNKYIYLGAEREDKDLKKLNIFTTTRPDSFADIRKSVQTLCQEVSKSGKNAALTIAEFANAHITKTDKMDWRWYFAKYAVMRPQACDTLGRYDWGYSPRSFEQRELSSKTLHGENWNPFLWAVYVEAGLENRKQFKNMANWINGEESENVSQIIFSIDGSRLAIRPYEFYWWINSPTARLGPKQKQKLAELRKILARDGIMLLDDGTYFIPGVDSGEIDYDNFDWDEIYGIYRLYDNEDRIEVGVKIARALANL